jgi:hypothetical protein
MALISVCQNNMLTVATRGKSAANSAALGLTPTGHHVFEIPDARRWHVAEIVGVEAIYIRPQTSQRHPHHLIYLCPLRKTKIDRPNQVSGADITFVPIKNGFLSLVAIMDQATRKVLS